MELMGRIALAVALAVSQTPQPVVDSPTFESVTVTPNDSRENGTYFNYRLGRLYVTRSTLRVLIRTSYGVQDAQIVGGPDWMNVDHFNIEAKGEAGIPRRSRSRMRAIPAGYS